MPRAALLPAINTGLFLYHSISSQPRNKRWHIRSQEYLGLLNVEEARQGFWRSSNIWVIVKKKRGVVNHQWGHEPPQEEMWSGTTTVVVNSETSRLPEKPVLVSLCTIFSRAYILVENLGVLSLTLFLKVDIHPALFTCTCRSDSCCKYRSWSNLCCIFQKLRFTSTGVSNQ